MNLNVHFHLLVLDGVYIGERSSLRFVPVAEQSADELQRLVQRIGERIGRALERAGLITRDTDNNIDSRRLAGSDRTRSAGGLNHKVAKRPFYGSATQLVRKLNSK